MKIRIFALLMLICAGTHAQTYDLTIQIESSLPSQDAVFTGSFTYANGALSNVNVNNPSYFGGTFTDGTYSTFNGPAVKLIDTYEGVPGYSTYTVYLSFNLLSLLGGSDVGIAASSVAFGEVAGKTQTICAGTYYEGPLACSASLKEVATAPEIGFDGALLTLLGGALCVVRGRARNPLQKRITGSSVVSRDQDSGN